MSKTTSSKKLQWYAEGLPFQCTQCGQCCTGKPGVVWLSERERETLAAHLGLSLEEFTTRFCRQLEGRWALKEIEGSYDCIFLKDRRCSVYPARPTQCRTFPFWPDNLHSKEAWEQTATVCEGINSEAPIVALEEIERQQEIQKESEST